ncbi:conserved hypothetical protein [Xenorhabdus cabanillasii JM26]|uniref:Uncharacterized protein n=1 Tax=Xenorhabdus cabanillasii JM26 TaxID=1427517 RepID=W1J731_9GAMM|nr:conserved hypothetical protein [Xenorhabdus cabanillasii JM26]
MASYTNEMDSALGKAALFLAGESPVVEGKPDHIWTSSVVQALN